MSAKKPLVLTLLEIILLALGFFAFGAWNIPTARAQAASATQMPQGAVISIRSDVSSFGVRDAVTVHISITNRNRSAIRVLKRLTPLDDTEKPLFTVTRDGKPVNYLGKVIKYAAPTEQDYTTLAAGESITGSVDLAAYYDLSITGNYSITYHTASTEMYADTNNGNLVRNAGSLMSNRLELLIAAHAALPAKKIVGTAVSGSTTFSSCSASQQSILINARNSASTYTKNVMSYFSVNKKDARYTTWFGIFDASRYSAVSSHYNSLHNAIDNANPMTFDCTCTDPYYAYVYPDSPYIIYLCPYFWSAPLTGTDSKAGTLIHETSHFTIVAGTDDHAYGQDNAKSLAITNPALAIMNADSHEYFAENNPALGSPSTITVYSISAQDGWVRESSETSNLGLLVNNTGGALVIGDNLLKQQYRSILSFNTSNLPDTAILTGVTLKVKKQGVAGGGDPVATFQGFMVDIKTGFFGTAPTLQASDFQALANKTLGPASPILVSGFYNISITNDKAYINKLATNGGLTQIRLRFKLDDNNDALTNYLSLYSGEAVTATDRPHLVITYTLP